MPALSTERRHRIGEQLRRRGVEIHPPCRPCFRRDLRCFASSALGICSECYTFHRRCSLTIPNATWQQLDLERERVERELERVEEERRELQRQLRHLQRDERRLLSREMASIEELEGLEATEAGGLVENGPAVSSGVEGSSSTTVARDPVRPVAQGENEPAVQGAGQPGLDQVEFGQLVFDDQMDSGDVDWSGLMDLADWDFDDETPRLV
jgi:hypothetical protein